MSKSTKSDSTGMNHQLVQGLVHPQGLATLVEKLMSASDRWGRQGGCSKNWVGPRLMGSRHSLDKSFLTMRCSSNQCMEVLAAKISCSSSCTISPVTVFGSHIGSGRATLWMDKILNRFDSMGNHYWLASAGER